MINSTATDMVAVLFYMFLLAMYIVVCSPFGIAQGSIDTSVRP